MSDNKNRSISDMVGQILGIDPTVKYRASMLPLVKTKEDRVELGLPSALVSMFESFMLPGHVVQGGSYTPEDVTNMAMNVGMMGAPVGYATAPRGALEMGGSRSSNMNSAFDEWFKGSKIVDDIGQPLTVYHGTKSALPISSFDPTKGKIITDVGNMGVGTYFTPQRFIAEAYAKPRNNVYDGFLSIKNPYDVLVRDANYVHSISDIARSVGVKSEPLWSGTKQMNLDFSKELTQRMLDAGYDGMIGRSGNNSKDIIEIVSYNPSNFKSINNKGTWNPNDPRIMYSNPLTAAIPQIFTYTNQENQK